jgi:excisionase family DNA binding protein
MLEIRMNPSGLSLQEFAQCLPDYAKITQSNPISPVGTHMNEASDEILTIEEVAAYLKAGRRTVYRLAANGQIPAFKLGGTWRFRRIELDQWIANRIGTRSQPQPDEKQP